MAFPPRVRYPLAYDARLASLEHLDLREVTLVAHSMGGGEVIRYLTRKGDARVARIAATLPFPKLTPDNPDGVPACSDARRASRMVRVPALIIQGDADESIPLAISAAKSARLIPHSRLVVFENAPHGLYLTHRAQLNEALLTFVS